MPAGPYATTALSLRRADVMQLLGSMLCDYTKSRPQYDVALQKCCECCGQLRWVMHLLENRLLDRLWGLLLRRVSSLLLPFFLI